MPQANRAFGGLADKCKGFWQCFVENGIEYLAVFFALLRIGEHCPAGFRRFVLRLIGRLHPLAEFVGFVAQLLLTHLFDLWFQCVYFGGHEAVFFNIAGVGVEQFR